MPSTKAEPKTTKAKSTGSNSAETQTKKRPVHEIRCGRIKAAIWENETENGTLHNVTVTRIYRHEDQWRDTTSLGRDDLLVAAKVLDQAHTWIVNEAQAE